MSHEVSFPLASYAPRSVGTHKAEVAVQSGGGKAVLAVELGGNLKGFDVLENAVRRAFEDACLGGKAGDDEPTTLTLTRPDGSSFGVGCEDEEDFKSLVVGVRIVSWAKAAK